MKKYSNLPFVAVRVLFWEAYFEPTDLCKTKQKNTPKNEWTATRTKFPVAFIARTSENKLKMTVFQEI